MAFAVLWHILLPGLLFGAGLLNLVWMFRRRGSPAEFRGCLLAATALLLLASALLAQVNRQNVPAGVMGALGGGCGLAWFYHIYRQSLHNTTM